MRSSAERGGTRGPSIYLSPRSLRELHEEAMTNMNIVRPGMSPNEIITALRASKKVFLTSVGMRDAGQSDFKNRLRIYDLKTLAPYYEKMGLFSAECHGGARWHVGIMNRRESPFEETALLRELMPSVLLQTLIRETNLFGYRPYPKNVIEYTVSHVDIDVWRCFSFLNDVRNMRSVAEVVMKRGRLFEPTISFTSADWTTNEYYLTVVRDIIDLCGGVDEIVLCIKDMAGVGDVTRIGNLIDAIKQSYPTLVINYHRHITDGLAIPALLSAARRAPRSSTCRRIRWSGFTDTRPFSPSMPSFEEMGIPVHLDRTKAEEAVQKVREWIGHYDWAESPFKGLDHTVTQHKMPGGAFPSSFEQAQRGEFLHLMPAVLKFMSLYNRIVKYFDVTPGSQITWVTCSGIINRYAKERGDSGVKHILALMVKFIEEKDQDLAALSSEEQEELLMLFRNAPGDFQRPFAGQLRQTAGRLAGGLGIS